MVRVERVARSVGEDQLRLELPDQVRQPFDGGRVHDEWVVTEVEAPEVRAEGRCGGLRLAVTDLFHALLRLPVLLPQLARLAPLAVGECDHVRRAPTLDDVAIAPAARQTKSAACALTTRMVLGTGELPRVDDRHRAHILLREAGLEQAVGHQGEAVLHRWVRHLAEIGRENVVLGPVARIASNVSSHDTLPEWIGAKQRSSTAPRPASSRCSSTGLPASDNPDGSRPRG